MLEGVKLLEIISVHNQWVIKKNVVGFLVKWTQHKALDKNKIHNKERNKT